MTTINVYLPEDLYKLAKKLNINVSKLLQEELRKVLGTEKCQACGQEIPRKKLQRGTKAPSS